MASTRFCNACLSNCTIDSGTIMLERGKHCPMYGFVTKITRRKRVETNNSKANVSNVFFHSGHGYLRMRGWPTGLSRFVQSRWRSSPSITWQTYPGLDSIDSSRIHREKVAKTEEREKKKKFEFICLNFKFTKSWSTDTEDGLCFTPTTSHFSWSGTITKVITRFHLT